MSNKHELENFNKNYIELTETETHKISKLD